MDASKRTSGMEGKKTRERGTLTFENNSVIRNPDIAKGPRVLTRLNKHPAHWALDIREDVDPRMLLKSLDRLSHEAIPVLSR